MTKSKRGWLDIAGIRMCQMDIQGGWQNIINSMELFAGKDTTRRVLFEAGYSGTFSMKALETGILKPARVGFIGAVDTYAEAGFGDFIIQKLNLKEGFARVSCEDTFEGWSFLQNNKFSTLSECCYTSGSLLSFMHTFSKRNGLISEEIQCIAKGDERCEFIIGHESQLRRLGIELTEWGMPIKEKAEYLENLLKEKNRLEKEVLLNQRLALLGQFSADVAHEIRNPLSAVKTNIQVLSKNLNLSGFNKRRFEIVENEIERLESILRDTLEFTVPLRMEIRSDDLHQVIEKSLELLGDKIKDNNVHVIKNLSPCSRMAPICFPKMKQAILNLFLNSLDAMTKGGNLDIRTEKVFQQEHPMVLLEIRDSGCGIKVDNHSRIFDPFFSTKTKGAGLGLSNVKKIIDAHGGTVEVESRVGEGTLFKILLPLVRNNHESFDN